MTSVMLFVPFFCISTLQSTQFIRLLYSGLELWNRKTQCLQILSISSEVYKSIDLTTFHDIDIEVIFRYKKLCNRHFYFSKKKELNLYPIFSLKYTLIKILNSGTFEAYKGRPSKSIARRDLKNRKVW